MIAVLIRCLELGARLNFGETWTGEAESYLSRTLIRRSIPI